MLKGEDQVGQYFYNLYNQLNQGLKNVTKQRKGKVGMKKNEEEHEPVRNMNTKSRSKSVLS